MDKALLIKAITECRELGKQLILNLKSNMTTNEPNFDVEYLGPITTIMDWVAGGNFDGYVFRNTLKFIKDDKKVILQTQIIDKSRFDEDIQDSEKVGKFEYTAKRTLTCSFGELRMKGVIIGKEKKYIAFTIFRPEINYPMTATYEIKC